MALTISSSSRYRDIMTINQWLENQDSWLEALHEGGRGMLARREKHFFLSVCKNFWLKEDEMMNFILWVSHEMKLHACYFAQKIWGYLPWHRHIFHQNIF